MTPTNLDISNSNCWGSEAEACFIAPKGPKVFFSGGHTVSLTFCCPIFSQAEENNSDEDDEDEWEDASDLGEDDEGEEEGSDVGHDLAGDEKKDEGKEKPGKNKDKPTSSPARRSRQTAAGSPKDQRTPRPKIHIPSPAPVQESPEGVKPLSPFSLLDGHRPVTDWGEEMEMLSPRSSMGGESPLKPPSVEASPPKKNDQEQEELGSRADGSRESAEMQAEEETGMDN